MNIENLEENIIPEEMIPDEGWWNSILTDEEKYLEKSKERNTQEKTENNHSTKNDWNLLEGVFKNDEIIQLNVTGFNRGGLLVEGANIQGFVPVSHLVNIPSNIDENDRKELIQDYVGKDLSLKVIEFVPEDERIVFSERAALAGEGKRKTIFENIHPGDVVSGIVTNVTDFGVFVDLGGLEGLIHVSELSWGRVQRTADILNVGQKIDAQVLSVSKENARVALSYKRLTRNPWESIHEVYTPGDVVSAQISSLTKYGAFARLKEGIEGLIHISTIKLPEDTHRIEEYLKIDQWVQVRILHIEIDKKRIGLSLV